MELRPPKLRSIAPSDRLDSKELQKKLWEIDSPSLEWSLGLAYLFSALKKDKFEYSFRKLMKFGNMPKVNEKILNAKRLLEKFNPFKNKYGIYSDEMVKTLEYIKFKIHAEVKLKEQETSIDNLLKVAAKLFDCVIMFYVVDVEGTCKFLFNSDNREIASSEDSLKISIIQRKSTSSDTIEKFGFGLSVEDSQPLKKSALVQCLKTAKLSNDKIDKVRQATFLNNNFLVCLFREGCEYIIPSIYKSPFIVSLISEAGFDTNPCSLDESGFSSFFHSMRLLDNMPLRILYDFVVCNSPENTEADMLDVLEKVYSVIERDCIVSNNFLKLGRTKDIALKKCHEILHFNEYQRKICLQICKHKQMKVNEEVSTNVMISILSIYSEYFNFSSINTDVKEKVFKDFVKYNYYYEYLDNFTCLLFFKNLPNLLPLIDEYNSRFYYEAISSLYLMVLSNEYFPFYRHEIDCNNCELNANDCEQIMNSRRFIQFHYRAQFLQNAENLTKNLNSKLSQQNPSNTQQKKATALLDILRKSLLNLPEIVDEFIILRLINYLKVARDSMQSQDSLIKRMLIMKRALQITGESLHNETDCKSVVRFLLRSCISSELICKLCKMRDNTLSHHRENTVLGKLKIEQDEQLVQNIQKDLILIYDIFQPVCFSLRFRVKEFLTKEVKIEIQNNSEIQDELDFHLRELISLRKQEFDEQKNNFYVLLCNVFKRLQENLAIEGEKLSNDTKSGLEALNFLMNFVADHCDSNYSAELKQVVIEFEDSNVISQEMKNDIESVITSNMNVTRKIFENLNEQQFDVNFPCIFSLNDEIKNFDGLSYSEKKLIICKVIEYVKNSVDLIKSLIDSLEAGETIEDIENKLNLIIMPENKRSLVSMKINKSPRNALEILRRMNEEDRYENVCHLDPSTNILTHFREREELLNMLLKINVPRILKGKIVSLLNHKLLFLVNRIKQLETILIFEDESISALWKSSTWKLNTGIEKQMKFLMMQRYVRENELQASLEMLLFDCMNILEQRQDLKDLWEKTNDLFKGANIADFLAHGNPILQSVSSLLSPEDLPSEFINKIIELIQDADAIKALTAMWEKTELCKISEFLNAVRSEEVDENSDFRKRIKKCDDRWEGYAKLLPLK